jgi:hypothetical protein
MIFVVKKGSGSEVFPRSLLDGFNKISRLSKLARSLMPLSRHPSESWDDEQKTVGIECTYAMCLRAKWLAQDRSQF